MNQNGWLRIVRECELFFRSFPGNARQVAAQNLVRFIVCLLRDRKLLSELPAHADKLRTLTWEKKTYQRMTEEAHVNPAPNATISMLSPRLMRPVSIASSSATGTVAELMLP